MSRMICQTNPSSRSGLARKHTAAVPENGPLAQFFVFRGDEFLGWDCFNKEKVTAGSSTTADLVLPGENIADIQAAFRFNGKQVVVSNEDHGQGLLVNGKPVTTSLLGSLDLVTIGPYDLKIKLKRPVDRCSDLEISAFSGPTAESVVSVLDLAKGCPAAALTPVEDPSKKDTQPNEDRTNGRRYKVIFNGKTVEGRQREDVKRHLRALLKTERKTVERLFSNTCMVIKQDVDYETALKYFDAFKQAGAICELEALKRQQKAESAGVTDGVIEFKPQRIAKAEVVEEGPTSQVVSQEVDQRDHDEDDTTDRALPLPQSEDTKGMTGGQPSRHISPTGTSHVPAYVDEEDEEDDEGMVAPFCLKEKIVDAMPHGEQNQHRDDMALQIVKCRKDDVIDISFLRKKEKYYKTDENGRFRLAENKKANKCYFYFNDQFNGTVQSNDGLRADIEKLRTRDNLHRKRKRIYRKAIPSNGHVILSDGYYDYVLRKIVRNQGPQVAEPAKKGIFFHKHLVKSSAFHAVILVFLTLFVSLPDSSRRQLPEARFVQIDERELLDRKKIKPVQRPKKAKPTQRPKEVEPFQKSAKMAKKTAPDRAKSRRKGGVSRSPKAGGGAGKAGGNIANRNINVHETGILGALGIKDGIGLMPKEALAAVTNLDAVPSARGGEANFKVGGIVGKLGSSKIEVPSGPVINTKGSAAVLRSAGVRGKGRIAALEKGKTGGKKVQGMVTASLSKTVRIQGGMSREAVKRVIDQHLDEISYCYECALISNPSIMGKMVFEWKILMSGKVGEVRIKSSSIQSSDLHSCLKGAIRSWQFPKPKGAEVVVSYPFVFDIIGF
ncbi:MAG: AgmX/PglI C-terminal domain-containing protein [Deltaproteobacteria bacterium]